MVFRIQSASDFSFDIPLPDGRKAQFKGKDIKNLEIDSNELADLFQAREQPTIRGRIWDVVASGLGTALYKLVVIILLLIQTG